MSHERTAYKKGSGRGIALETAGRCAGRGYHRAFLSLSGRWGGRGGGGGNSASSRSSNSCIGKVEMASQGGRVKRKDRRKGNKTREEPSGAYIRRKKPTTEK